jgi:hypothetical protein
MFYCIGRGRVLLVLLHFATLGGAKGLLTKSLLYFSIVLFLKRLHLSRDTFKVKSSEISKVSLEITLL